jgi:hypothetical protein
MKTEIVRALTDNFEAHIRHTGTGVEFWLARDIQYLLGYAEWRNFNTVVSKAKTACELSGHAVSDHFVSVTKMVDLGSGSRDTVLHPRRLSPSFCAESPLPSSFCVEPQAESQNPANHEISGFCDFAQNDNKEWLHTSLGHSARSRPLPRHSARSRQA